MFNCRWKGIDSELVSFVMNTVVLDLVYNILFVLMAV